MAYLGMVQFQVKLLPVTQHFQNYLSSESVSQVCSEYTKTYVEVEHARHQNVAGLKLDAMLS